MFSSIIVKLYIVQCTVLRKVVFFKFNATHATLYVQMVQIRISNRGQTDLVIFVS